MRLHRRRPREEQVASRQVSRAKRPLDQVDFVIADFVAVEIVLPGIGFVGLIVWLGLWLGLGAPAAIALVVGTAASVALAWLYWRSLWSGSRSDRQLDHAEIRFATDAAFVVFAGIGGVGLIFWLVLWLITGVPAAIAFIVGAAVASALAWLFWRSI